MTFDEALDHLLMQAETVIGMSERGELHYANPRTGNVRPLGSDGMRQAVDQVRAQRMSAQADASS